MFPERRPFVMLRCVLLLVALSALIGCSRTDGDVNKVNMVQQPLKTFQGDPIYRVVVDRSKSLDELFKDCKCYSNEIDGIFSNNPHNVLLFDYNDGKGKEEVEIVLFHFDHEVLADDVVEEMKKQEYRPICLGELLTLGAAYPEVGSRFPIIAPHYFLSNTFYNPLVLGSLVTVKVVASLETHNGSRDLVVITAYNESSGKFLDAKKWNKGERFAAIKIKTPVPPRISQTYNAALDFSENPKWKIMQEWNLNYRIYRISDESYSFEYIVGSKKKIEVALFYFHDSWHEYSLREIISEMKKRGFRPARTEEMIALALSYPEAVGNMEIFSPVSIRKKESSSEGYLMPHLSGSFFDTEILMLKGEEFQSFDEKIYFTCFAAVRE